MPPAEFHHHLLRRLVFHRPKLLEHGQPPGLQLVFGQVRTAQHVGVDRQRLGQVVGQHGAAIAGVGTGDGLAPLHAQVVEVEDELAAVARAGAASAISQVKLLRPSRSAGS